MLRTVTRYTLGEKILGLTGVYTSILGTLSVAELGFSTAIICTMYKPASSGDIVKVNALLNYYRKIYRRVGMIILFGGMATIPLLPFFIKDEAPSSINAIFLYMMYVVNSSISYFMYAYKQSILEVMQRNDLIQKVRLVVQFVKYILQIVVLLGFKNYYLFMIVYILSTLAENIWISYLCNKNFPQYKSEGIIEKAIHFEIKKQVGGMMIGRICDASRNTLDTLILSYYLGLTTVTIYGNYFTIYTAVYTVVGIFGVAMQASVGNKVSLGTREQNYQDLRKFQFIHSWIVGWCSICMACLYQPFMELWMGKELVLSTTEMILFVLYFYLICANNMRNLYITGDSLFWKMKISYLLEAVSNLILNIVLGKYWGITGILVATIITIVVFNFIHRNIILFREYFEVSSGQFHIENLVYTIVIALIGFLTYRLCLCLVVEGISLILFRGLICLIVPNIIIFLISYRTKLFKQAIALLERK